MKKKGKLDFLQVFRALAAGLVAIAHMAKEISHQPAFADSAVLHQLRSGTFGVDIFFIISGFIMIYTTRNASGGRADASGFLARRLLRIVPLYWFYTSLFVAVILFHPSTLNHSMTNLAHVLGSYLFLPVPRPEDGMIEPVLGLGWTLNYEMYFYAIFALCLLLPRRFLVPLICAYFAMTVAAGIFVGREVAPLWYWTRTSVLEFIYGALIAVAFLKGIRINTWLAAAAAIVGLVAWQAAFVHYSFDVEDVNLRGIIWGIPAALLVGAVSLWAPGQEGAQRGLGGRLFRGLVSVGDGSYSLYLSHMFVVRLLTFVLPIATLGEYYPAVFFVLGLGLCIIVAQLSYVILERPILERGRVLLAPASSR